MDTNHEPQFDQTITADAAAAIQNGLLGIIAAVTLFSLGTGTTIVADISDASPCCDPATASASTGTKRSPAVIATTSDDGRESTPDDVADYVGGIAARLHIADGTPVPGHVFLLMATADSKATSRLYDQTPFAHSNEIHADSLESNATAIDTVERITGVELDMLDLTTAPGGGPSGGITYTIAYLNIISDGAFTGDLRVAATGELGTHGYVNTIGAINEKTAAAHLADADVLFTPSTPTAEIIEVYGARQVGEMFRVRKTDATLAEERQLENYENWGVDRPIGMDIVGTRHIADVAAYLCGAGSNYACEVVEILADDVIGVSYTADDRTDQKADYATGPRLH